MQDTLELERRLDRLMDLVEAFSHGGVARTGLEVVEDELVKVGELFSPVSPGSPEEEAMLLAGRVLQCVGLAKWVLGDVLMKLENLADGYAERAFQPELPWDGPAVEVEGLVFHLGSGDESTDPFDPTGFGPGATWD